MTSSMHSKLSTLALAVALTACGGGGSGSGANAPGTDLGSTLPGDTSPGGSGGGAGTTPSSPIQTTVPAASYAPGSGEAAVYALLNAERARCSFGLLTQNNKLDLAAGDAVNYWKLRLQESDAAALGYAHIQDPDASGFTGRFPQDRTANHGFSGAVHESLVRQSASVPLPESAEQTANRLAQALLGSVYHMQMLMRGHTNVGIAYASEIRSASDRYYYSVTLELGVPAGTGEQDSPDLRTYPCDGSAAANARFKPGEESPNPAPDLGKTTIVGTPILLQSGIGTKLGVTSYTIAPASGGTPVAARVITAADDVQFMIRSDNTAFLLPLSPLVAGQPYRVDITVTIDAGAPITRHFTFTPVDGGA